MLLGPFLLKAIVGVSGHPDVDCDCPAFYIATAQFPSYLLWPFADDSQEGCTMVPNYGLLVVSGFMADQLGTIRPQCNDSSVAAGLSA